MTKKIFKLPFVLLIITILAIFLSKIPLLFPLENLVIRTISPIQKGFYYFGTSTGEKLSPFFIKKNLIEENKELRAKLIELYKENTELKLKEKDYQALKTQLEFLEEKNYQYIFAQVIGKGSLSLNQILILNKGSKDDLKEGLPVIINNGVLIGKLIKVNKNTSQVLLLLDDQSRVAAVILTPIEDRGKDPVAIQKPHYSESRGILRPDEYVGAQDDKHRRDPSVAPRLRFASQNFGGALPQDDSETMGIIKGQYDLSLAMDLIPLDKKITSGDLVITSGLEPEIPSGLLIGTIKEVETVPGQLFQKATVIPMSSFEGLRIVTVILNK